MILTCLAAAVSVGIGWQTADVGKLEVPLTFQAFESFDPTKRLGLSGSENRMGILDRSTRVKQFTIPSNALLPSLIRIGLEGNNYYIVLAKSDAKLKRSDLMWVDWNGDKILTDDEMAKPLPLVPLDKSARNDSFSRMSLFMPVRFGEGIKPVAFQLLSQNQLVAVPAGMMVGTIPIGKGIKIGLVDSNMNGEYCDELDRTENYAPGDNLLIDRNGNGKFDPIDYTSYDITKNESVPYMSLIQIGTEFQTLEVAPKGNSLSLTPYAGPIATLKFVGGKPLSLVCQGTKHIVHAFPVNGSLRVPFMATQALQITYSFNDAKSNAWKSAIYEEGKSNLLVADKEITFKCGPPLTVILKETRDVGGFSFSVEIKDAGGHSLGSLTDQKLQNPPAPTLQIKDAKGKVIKSIPFAYG